MRFSLFKAKPLVVAVSKCRTRCSFYLPIIPAASIDVSTNISGLNITAAQDYLRITTTGTITGSDFGVINISIIGTLSNAGIITGSDGSIIPG
ncbi:MAG: hypothetical protein ACR5LD_07665 [Symbiopectobacterium sp.]